jgi:hypothetical protein
MPANVRPCPSVPPLNLHGKEEVRFVCRRRQLQAKHLLGRYRQRNSFPKALVRGQLRAGASTGAPDRQSLQLGIFLTIFKTGEAA